MKWAIVEVMGHRRYAGQVEEVTVAGTPMLRVHVPGYTSPSNECGWRTPTGDVTHSWSEDAVEWQRPIVLEYPPFVVDLGGGALFAVTGCTEERARKARPSCHDGDQEPTRTLGEWGRRSHALTGPVEDAEVVLERPCAQPGCDLAAEPGLLLCEEHQEQASDELEYCALHRPWCPQVPQLRVAGLLHDGTDLKLDGSTL